MTKPCVIVTRTSSPFWVGGKGASARGDMDTEPLLKRLVEERPDLDVVFYGVIKGNVDYCDTFPVDIQGVTADTHEQELMDRWDPVIEAVRERNPVCMIELFGQPPSWSWPDNPNAAFPHDWCVRYCAPVLYALHKLKVPRYGIVTDPKCYRRDMEMSLMWPECTPAAVLSQEDRTFPRVIGGYQYNVHARYAACEFWLTRELERQEHEKQWYSSICANAHLTENRLPKGRTDLWSEILEAHDPRATRICGAGWDKHPLVSEDREWKLSYVGVLKSFEQVLKFIGHGNSGVMIPQWPGFNSTKPRLYALNGTVPRLFGDGSHDMTYDRDERILPLNHPARFVIPFEKAHYDPDETIELVLERTKPNFSLLDQLIDETIEKGCSFPSPEWIVKYGGYEPCGQQ